MDRQVERGRSFGVGRFDAEPRWIAKRRHVHERQDVRHRSLYAAGDVAGIVRQVQVRDYEFRGGHDQWTDARRGNFRNKRGASHLDRPLHARQMREALDIVQFAAANRERRGQCSGRQGGLVERANGNVRFERDRPDRSGEHVLIGPGPPALCCYQRPVTDEIAHANRRDGAFKLDGGRPALGQRHLAGHLQRQRRAVHT